MSRWLRHLARIRYRLLLVNLLAVAVPLAGIGFARFHEQEMLRAVESDMIHQAQLLREVLLADPAGPRLAARRPLLARVARQTGARIRLLDPTGAVAADSHPWLRGDPVDRRREVRRALDHGRYGAATRSGASATFLVSALPLHRDGRALGVVYISRATTPVRAAMRRLRSSLARVLIAALAATSVLTLLLAATISRPLARLSENAQRIASGDRSAKLALARRDEIGDLARAVDAMARKLQGQARETRDLAANISHEFKSPLTGIRGAAELLADGADDDPAARRRFLANIIADARRLDRMVSRLLELSRAISDDPAEEALDYPELLAELAPAARLEYRTGQTILVAPRAHLESVVLNLVANATEHAEPGTQVTIAVERDGPMLTTSVHNAGRPIRPADLERVWDRFFTTRSDRGGTGLGLPIVRAIVSARGGEVGVTSAAATGTTFFFRLPAG
jgi:two-component system, OmpR family, sensor histidine kinase ChvG